MRSLLLLSLLAILLPQFLQYQTDSPFHQLRFLSEVPRSGDQYPKIIPETTNPTLFQNLQVLFALSHGVEDHEVYYLHQYLTSRGAIVQFGCPENFSILSDFFKPSHKVICQQLSQIDLESFDAIYIPGGLPSSSAIRKEKDFQSKLSLFFNNPNNKDKLVMMICSGTENLIDSGLITNVDAVTGSPASQWTFFSYFTRQGRPLDEYKGNSDSFPSISYPSDGLHAHLVLGRNPAGSVAFVVSIAKTWKRFDENIDLGKGVPVRLINDTWYDHPDFEILRDDMPVTDIANFMPKIQNEFEFSGKIAGKKVYVAVSSGADYEELLALTDYFLSNQAEVTFSCPGWIIDYKEAKVFLFSNPPTTPIACLLCNKAFDKTSPQDFDVLLVPGGLFSTNGVLRNDNNLVDLMKNSKLVGLTGSGNDLLLPLGEIIDEKVVRANDVESDLRFAGGIVGKNQAEVLRKGGKTIVLGKAFDENFTKLLNNFI